MRGSLDVGGAVPYEGLKGRKNKRLPTERPTQAAISHPRRWYNAD